MFGELSPKLSGFKPLVENSNSANATSTASALNTIAAGVGSFANGVNDIVIGTKCSTNSPNSVVIGTNCKAGNNNTGYEGTTNVVIGNNVNISNTGSYGSGYSVAIGNNIDCKANSICIGTYNASTTYTGAYSIVLVTQGNSNTISGSTACIEIGGLGQHNTYQNYSSFWNSYRASHWNKWQQVTNCGTGNNATSGQYGAAQYSYFHLYWTTTTATPATLLTGAGDTNNITFPNARSAYVKATVCARQYAGTAGATSDAKAFVIEFLLTNATSTCAIVGTPVTTIIGQSANASAWTCVPTVTTGGVISFTVTGETNKSISWSGRIEFVEAA
jgi:hypothetical protein